ALAFQPGRRRQELLREHRGARPVSALVVVLATLSAAPSPPLAPTPPSVALLQQVAAETAVSQVRAPDPSWSPEQRDCAGLIRFPWREAYRRLQPERLARPLFRDDAGAPSDFADARTLVASNLHPLGRGDPARAQLQSGDVLAFRQDRPDGEVW